MRAASSNVTTMAARGRTNGTASMAMINLRSGALQDTSVARTMVRPGLHLFVATQVNFPRPLRITGCATLLGEVVQGETLVRTIGLYHGADIHYLLSQLLCDANGQDYYSCQPDVTDDPGMTKYQYHNAYCEKGVSSSTRPCAAAHTG